MARLDKYLAKLNGAAGSVPAPVSSLDREMDELAKNPPSGGGLPEVTAADNGDVLTVVDGEWGKAAPSGGGGVPEVETADKGKFLHADAETGELEWAEAGGLPEVETADKGKFLHANDSTGELEWVESSAPAIKLTESGSNLVNTSYMGWDINDKLWNVSKYYTDGGNGFDKNITWYSVVSSKYALSPPTAEIVIKNEATGALYKHSAYDDTLNFAPYTP